MYDLLLTFPSTAVLAPAMKPRSFFSAALYVSSAVAACDNILAPSHANPELASGWKGQLIANGFTKPRSILFDDAGGLLVLDSGVGIRRVELEDNGGTCLSVTENELIVDDEEVDQAHRHLFMAPS